MAVVNRIGKLVLEGRNVTLKTGEDDLHPVPFSIGTAISTNAMRAIAYSTYKNYIGHRVTMSGECLGILIYSARVIRTREERREEPSKIPGVKPTKEPYGKAYWNTRVPKADVLFTARKLPGFDMRFKVDVRQMITINDSVIHRDLVDHSLMVSDPNSCDDEIYLIYYHTRVKKINPYVYEYDQQAFGCEFFMYPYELRQLQKGDCDDWGIELASYLISAGVPEWRVRCVVGRTHSGIGHLTVYVLADDLEHWHHINSTTSWRMVESRGYRKLTDFPQPGDPGDAIGIKDIWFSFNNEYAWHAFETHESADDALREPWMHSVEITPLFDAIGGK